MSDPAPTIWPHDDLDAFESAAWSAVWRWMRLIEPFQQVQFGFIGQRYEALGRELTQHLDAEARERRAQRWYDSQLAQLRAQPGYREPRSLRAIMADIEADANRARAEAADRMDHVASGW